MEGNSKLIALEESFDRLYGGLNAMDLMVLGLMQARDPHAEGLNVLYNYLQEAASDMKKILTAAMPA